MYHWDFQVLWSYRQVFLAGLAVTIAITIAVVLLGLLCGLIAGLGSLSRFWIVRVLANTYIGIFRCTPLIVQLLWFYYALPILLGVSIDAITASVLSLTLYGGSFYAEIIRGGIVSIDAGQSEAGYALGMFPMQVMRRIVLPQAIKRMVPPLVNQSIIQFKNTSLVSVLSVPDLVYQGQVAASDTFRPLEVYTIIGVIYVMILLPLTGLAKITELRFGRDN